MVKLKRLKIEKFRNVAPGTELLFRDSRNVLLGKNGTGKTTLLNLIVAVLDGGFGELQDEEFSLEYELVVPRGSLTVWVRNLLTGFTVPLGSVQSLAVSEPPISYPDGSIAFGKRAQYSASCEMLFHLADRDTKYRLKVEGNEGVLHQEGSTQEIRKPFTSPLLDGDFTADVGSWLWEVPLIKDAPAGLRDAVNLLVDIWRHSSVQRFDESLLYLDGLTDSKDLFILERTEQAVEVLRGSDVASSIEQRLKQELKANPRVDRIVLSDRDPGMKFLSRAVRLLGFASGELRLQRTARKAGPPEEIEFGDLQFYFVRRDGSGIDGSRLSYGQKRLLSFYYYLDCSAACAVADELVNGMHHEWIEACLEELGERQAFLTSQNPLLLDYLGFETAEEVRSSFVLCRSELQGEREQLRWENMTPEDAEGFFQAYQVGIQHVSEILRTRGLW
jgi:energy-coupling factor transporter ATP-binding protein EcfA2